MFCFLFLWIAKFETFTWNSLLPVLIGSSKHLVCSVQRYTQQPCYCGSLWAHKRYILLHSVQTTPYPLSLAPALRAGGLWHALCRVHVLIVQEQLQVLEAVERVRDRVLVRLE